MLTDKILGFTCIENQVLSLLNEYNQPEKCLYYDCAIPLHILFDYIVVENVPFYEFKIIERVQDILKALGIIEMLLVRVPVFEAIKLINNSTDVHFLIRVKPSFVNNKLHKRSLREDHFIRIEVYGEFYKLYNDIPHMSLLINEKEFIEAYDGQMFTIKYLRNISKEDIVSLHNVRRFRVEDMVNNELVYNNMHDDRIVDLVIIYKTLRQRMIEYYKDYYNTGFITKYINVIDKLRIQGYYSSIKKDKEGVMNVLNTLSNIESEIQEGFS